MEDHGEREEVSFTEIKRLAESDLVVKVFVIERTGHFVRREITGFFLGKGELDVTAEDRSLMDDYGKIEKLSFDISRKPDDEYHVLFGSFIGDTVHGFPGRVDKRSLAEKVTAGLSRDAEFREDEKCTAFVGVIDGSDDLISVIVDIRNAEFRGNRTYS